MSDIKIYKLFKEIDDVIKTSSNSTFSFKGTDWIVYSCFIKYLFTKDYVYIITEWKHIIIENKKGFKDKTLLIKEIHNNMNKLWFKEEEKSYVSKEFDEIEYFDNLETELFAEVNNNYSTKENDLYILCWRPASWKTSYYINNYKRPFFKFLINLRKDLFWFQSSWISNKYSYRNILRSLQYEDFKLKKAEFERKQKDLSFYFYLNLDRIFWETNYSFFSEKEVKELGSIIQNRKKEKNKFILIEEFIKYINNHIEKEKFEILIDWFFVTESDYTKIADLFTKNKFDMNLTYIYWEDNLANSVHNDKGRYDTWTVDVRYKEIDNKIKKDLLNINKNIQFQKQMIEKKNFNPLYYTKTYVNDNVNYYWLIEELDFWITYPEFFKYIYSSTWKWSWYRNSDDEENDYEREEEESDFWALKKLLKLVDEFLTDEQIKEIIDTVKEKVEVEDWDPYDRRQAYQYKADLDYVKSILESKWYNLDNFVLSVDDYDDIFMTRSSDEEYYLD